MDRSRDTTKFPFNGHEYGKGRLVLAVVHQYFLDNPDTTFAELLSVFPKQLQGSIGVFNEISEVSRKYGNKNHKRPLHQGHRAREAVRLHYCCKY